MTYTCLNVRLPLIIVLFAVTPAHAQWQIQSSPSIADLRGIHNAGNGVAWASGNQGVVLRTLNGGETWQRCAIPPGGEGLDFRGIHALDARTAMVMSAGKGSLSRLYKTSDGCQTWELLFTNPDEDGFWDALLYEGASGVTLVLGDPVRGNFVLYSSRGRDHRWTKTVNDPPPQALPGQTLFAASNSLLIGNVAGGQFSFVTGGSRPEIVTRTSSGWARAPLPLASGETSGAFSIAANSSAIVVAGGDYKHPDQRQGTGAFSSDSGYHFRAAETPPGGYRSAVAYDAPSQFWIAVGPNGSDISRDNGRTWSRLAPGAGDAPEADKNWNALSLPFAVGPHGRIGKLQAAAHESSR